MMRMKMRTLGRHHQILKSLDDGQPKRRCEIDGDFTMSARHLQELLIRGLVDRIPRDTDERGTYLITARGMSALDELESTQPYPDEMSEDLRQIRFRYRREIEYPDGTTEIKEGWTNVSPLGNVAHRGYKFVDVEVSIDKYWKHYFETRIW